jgi:hypothetical protein
VIENLKNFWLLLEQGLYKVAGGMRTSDFILVFVLFYLKGTLAKALFSFSPKKFLSIPSNL